MEFLKKFFSGKAFGYYVTLAVSLLFLLIKKAIKTMN